VAGAALTATGASLRYISIGEIDLRIAGGIALGGIPAVLVASFIPDAVLMITRFIPGTTTLGVLSLSTMHLIVAAVAIPIAQLIAPVTTQSA